MELPSNPLHAAFGTRLCFYFKSHRSTGSAHSICATMFQMKHKCLPGFAAAACCNHWDGVLKQAAAAAAAAAALYGWISIDVSWLSSLSLARWGTVIAEL
jgi:hypothetical protein